MKIVVTGGRYYTDAENVCRVLNDIHITRGPVTLLAQGGAYGADRLAFLWATEFEIPVRTFRANRDSRGRAGGPNRNAEMLDAVQPDLVIAFPGGRATANCVELAKTRGIEVLEFGE